MKNLFYVKFLALLFLFLGLIGSCTGMENEDLYTVRFKNTSNHTLSLFIKYNDNENAVPQILQPGEYSETYIHSRINNQFKGFFSGDSIEVKFENGKGYICNKNQSNNLCFSNKENPFSEDSFSAYVLEGENLYIYPITQQDYENAHDLP